MTALLIITIAAAVLVAIGIASLLALVLVVVEGARNRWPR